MGKINIDGILACRVQGSRLYGKPLQSLVPGGITIIESLIQYLREIKLLRKIVLAISEGNENHGFISLANRLSLPYVIGDEHDVLQRIIDAAEQEGSENVLRITTEGPFVLYEYADGLIEEFLAGKYDWGSYKDTPEGTGYELISTQALKVSHDHGIARHRSELVTSYICEHQEEFKLLFKEVPKPLRRPEVRLTVDYPEDLVFCQAVYRNLKEENDLIQVEKIIDFWDQNPDLRKPLENIGIDWGRGRLIWTSQEEQRVILQNSDLEKI